MWVHVHKGLQTIRGPPRGEGEMLSLASSHGLPHGPAACFATGLGSSMSLGGCCSHCEASGWCGSRPLNQSLLSGPNAYLERAAAPAGPSGRLSWAPSGTWSLRGDRSVAGPEEGRTLFPQAGPGQLDEQQPAPLWPGPPSGAAGAGAGHLLPTLPALGHPRDWEEEALCPSPVALLVGGA